MKTCDVAVIGAGPAGIAASVTAARAGMKTLLLEKQSFPGGTPVKGHITTLCGLYLSQPGRNAPVMLYNGFAREFAELLMKLDLVSGPEKMGRTYVLLFRPESFVAAAREVMETQSYLTAYYEAKFCGVRISEGRVAEIEAVLNGRRRQIRTGAVIDATGSAAVCRAAGVPLIYPDEARQVPALMFPLYGAGFENISGMGAARLYMMIRHAAEEGGLPPGAADVSFLPAPDPDCLLVKLNLGRSVKADPQMPESRLRHRANELKVRIVRFLRKNAAGFEKCTAPDWTNPVLHREGTRAKGAYVLSRRDVLSAKRFSDAAAKGCWPVEMWDEQGGFSVDYPPDGLYYDIPERCLCSVAVDNLFMAGKCISADSGAIASARVIACCLATGEAAAKLASDRAGNNSDLSVKD